MPKKYLKPGEANEILTSHTSVGYEEELIVSNRKYSQGYLMLIICPEFNYCWCSSLLRFHSKCLRFLDQLVYDFDLALHLDFTPYFVSQSCTLIWRRFLSNVLGRKSNHLQYVIYFGACHSSNLSTFSSVTEIFAGNGWHVSTISCSWSRPLNVERPFFRS